MMRLTGAQYDSESELVSLPSSSPEYQSTSDKSFVVICSFKSVMSVPIGGCVAVPSMLSCAGLASHSIPPVSGDCFNALHP